MNLFPGLVPGSPTVFLIIQWISVDINILEKHVETGMNPGQSGSRSDK